MAYDLPNLDLRVSPFMKQGESCIRQINCDHDLIGALKKRSGYITYLGTPDNSKVVNLFNWTRNNGTQFWNYRLSGSVLYYSTQGTGDWTVCGNGTFTGNNVGHGILEDVMIAELKKFISAIKKGTPLSPPPLDAYETLRLVEEVYKENKCV